MNFKIIKFILAIILILCLFEMPYGYYQFTRFIAMVGFSYLAYYSNECNKKKEVLIYIGLALLFQPFMKIALGRSIWNMLDLIVGVSLIVSLFSQNAKGKI